MQKYILRNKLKKIYKKKSGKNHFLNWKDIHAILVLFDTAYFEEAANFINQLINAGKKPTVYAYKRKNDKRDYSNLDYHILSEKEAKRWLGSPIYTIADKLKKERFDAVIDLTICQNISLEYLLACAHASIKTGLKKNDFPQYDLAITNLAIGEANRFRVSELGKQIVYYLNKIQAG